MVRKKNNPGEADKWNGKDGEIRIIFSLLLGLSERKVSRDPGDERVQKKKE